ncbi:MAG: hypothetical protein JJ891_06770 [Rhizobiaceae bacterium]|nr:hypothetical protein [Rhizobiaceae bacterium]
MEKYEYDVRKCAECNGSVQSFVLSDTEGFQSYLEDRRLGIDGFKVFYTVYRREEDTVEWEAIADLKSLGSARTVVCHLRAVEKQKEYHGV